MKIALFLALMMLFVFASFSCKAEQSIKQQISEVQGNTADYGEIFQFDENDEYQIIDGILFLKKTLYRYPGLKNASEYYVPDGTVQIDMNAFVGQKYRFDSLYLPNSCVDIGFGDDYQGEPAGFNTQNFVVSENHPFFSTQDGILFSKDKKILLLYPSREHEQEYTVPDSVERIGGFAFQGCQIGRVVLPDSVKEIGLLAFYGSQIKEIVLNEGLVSIEDFAFSGCENLASPKLPSTLKEIGSESFSCCGSIEHIDLADGIASIDTYAFWATPLKELTLPAGLTYIGDDICVYDFPGNTPLFYVYAGSYAHEWAVDTGVSFQVIDGKELP